MATLRKALKDAWDTGDLKKGKDMLSDEASVVAGKKTGPYAVCYPDLKAGETKDYREIRDCLDTAATEKGLDTAYKTVWGSEIKK